MGKVGGEAVYEVTPAVKLSGQLRGWTDQASCDWPNKERYLVPLISQQPIYSETVTYNTLRPYYSTYMFILLYYTWGNC